VATTVPMGSARYCGTRLLLGKWLSLMESVSEMTRRGEISHGGFFQTAWTFLRPAPRLRHTLALPGFAVPLLRRELLVVSLCCVCFVCAALLNPPCASAALLKIDFDQRYLHEPGWVIKDHAFIKVDSVYHVFYTRGPDYFQSPLTPDSIGHATSPDMKLWTFHPPVLAVQKSTWENGALWAPFVMEKPGGGYIMYYTGVDSNAVQRIGIATSEDLFTWTRYSDNPVFRPDTAWSAWDSTVEWSSCRDPHIYHEDGIYYMFVTTHANNGNGAVGSAISTDLFNWTDNGPVYVHSGTYPLHAIESCFLIKRNDKYRLFFSEQDTPPGVSYMASDSLYSGWSITTRRVVDYGIAPEILDDAGVQLLSRFGRFMKGDTINTAVKIDTLRWTNDIPTASGPHPLSQYWAEISGEACYYQPTFGDNSWERGGEHSGYKGNSWLGTTEYSQGPLQAGWSGWSLGEDARGYVTSYSFTVQADSISLLVGGGNHPDSAFVALYRASDDSLLFAETGKNSDTMDKRVWPVHSLRGQSVYLKIVDNASGYFGHINCDEIAEFFAPPDTVPPWVDLFEPSGAETLVQGEQFEIRWKAGDETGVDSVVLEYSLDGGLTYPYFIARPSPQDTSYLWTIPQTYSDSCLVHVTVYDRGPNSASDQSDSFFAMVAYIPDILPPWVDLFEPSGAETLVQGEQFEIRWKAGDETGVDSVVLEYSLDGGLTYPYFIARPSPQDTSYLWTIPQTYSDSCLVRATVYDSGPNSASDQSDSLFTIVAYIGVDDNSSDAPGIERKLALSVRGQNPFTAQTSLRFSLPQSFAQKGFSLDIFDIAGRHVRNLWRGICPASGTDVSVPWNACDERGVLVGSGIYFTLLRVDGAPILTRKIVLLR